MTSTTWPVDPPRAWWIAAGFAVLALATPILLSAPLTDAARLSLSGAALCTTGLITGTCCHLRARRLTGPRQRPWTLLGWASIAAVIGRAGSVAPDSTLPAVGTVGAGAALLLSIAALCLFTRLYVSSADRLTTVFDGVVVGGGLLIVVTSVMYPSVRSLTGGPAAYAWVVAFPLLDCLLVTLAVLVILRCPRAKRLPLTLVGLGCLVYGATDIASAVSSTDGGASMGRPLDVGWIAGGALIGLASLCPIPSSRAERRWRAALPPTASSVAVLGVCVLAVVGQAVLIHSGALPIEAGVLLTVAVVGAAGARQVLVTADNSSLRRDLHEQVDERTTDLRRVVSQMQGLLRSVGEGIYGVDDAGLLTFINPAGAEVLGYQPDQLLGSFVHDVFHVAGPDDDHGWETCSISKAIRTGAETTQTERYRRSDGARVPVDSTTTMMVDHTSSAGAVVVFREAGERLEVERLKDEFLSVLSHELRTPMTAIIGTLDILVSGELGDLPPPVRRLLTMATTSSLRLARLVDDLLDAERIKSGTRPLRLQELSAAALILQSSQQVRPMADQRRVVVRSGRTDGVVLAEGDKMVQTLVNLIGNAIKFSPEGAEVLVESFLADDVVCFEVRDHGSGIPANKLDAIFDRFVQVDSSDARAMGGTGLGLAISRDIVEQHGGHIEARSTLGVGTTIAFTVASAPPTGGTS